MTGAIVLGSEVLTMTSREIAELCEKRHDNVMADCRKLADFYAQTYSPEKSGEFVKSTTYTDSTGRSLPCFELNKQACLDLVTGYSLPHRHAVNRRWQELEAEKAQPKELSRLEILKLAMESEQARIEAEKMLALAAPKAEALDRIAQADGDMCITLAAKHIGMPPRKLMAWLEQNRWVYRRAGVGKPAAYQDRIQSGHLTHKVTTLPRDDGSEKVVAQVIVTAKGLAKLAEVAV